MVNLIYSEQASPDAKERIADKIREKFPGKCERILLINPTQTSQEAFNVKMAKAKSYPCYPPYGIALLCTALEEKGYVTSLFDVNYHILESVQKENGGFNYNVWKGTLRKKLEEFKPDFVGVTCMYTMVHSAMKQVTDFVKNYNPKIPIIAGGAHPALAAEEVLRNTPSVDFIAHYEADNSFPDMVDFINGKVERERLVQLSTLIDDKFIATSDRDTPNPMRIGVFPQYHDLKIGNYTDVGKIGVYASWLRGEDTKCTTILSSRGCRAHCSFCSVREFNGKGIRFRTVENVVDEMEKLIDTYDIQHFVWLDDDLFAGKQETVELFNEIAKRNLGITWDASNGVIAAYLTEELAQAAEDSGCIGMSFGIESGDPEILRRMHKPATLEKFANAAEVMKKHPSIFTKGFLIIGYTDEVTDETTGQIWNTIGLAKELGFDWYTIQIAMPLPGTEMAKGMIRRSKTALDITKESENRFMSGFGNTAAREYERKRRLLPDPEFRNTLFNKPKDYIPTRDELKDIWFLVDWMVNYEDVPKETNRKKLEMKETWLEEVCTRKSSENPLGNLYLAVVRDKLGKHQEAEENRHLARHHLKNSKFWSTRFKGLGLDKLLEAQVESLV